MGGCGPSSSSKSTGKKICMIGLSSSGKTTIFHQIVSNKLIKPAPTLGYFQENFVFQKQEYNIVDFGGKQFSKAENPMLNIRIYFTQSKALIYVIDASNKNQYQQVIDLFRITMNESDFRKLPVLIFLNKTDLGEQIITQKDIQQDFKVLNQKNILYNIQSCCALKNEGIQEGLTWINNQLNKK